MVSLTSVSERFLIPWTVVSGASGEVVGIVSETDQTSQPSYVFVRPRHVFRTRYPTALEPGMVIRSINGGFVFIVGDNGPSEVREGVLWQSFRVFEPTGQYQWQRRTKILDPVTRIPSEGPLEDLGMVYAAVESMDRMQADREMRQNFEQQRFITGANVRDDDIFDNRIVTKVDKQLGLAIGTLT
jgi:hypothetical protein